MFVVTLLTNPETPVLERVTVESLRNAWGGGAARWLDPGVAAEFALAAVPENQWEVWEGLQALRVDMVVQRAEGRRKRLLIADMESLERRRDPLAKKANSGDKEAKAQVALIDKALRSLDVVGDRGEIRFLAAFHCQLDGLDQQVHADRHHILERHAPKHDHVADR